MKKSLPLLLLMIAVVNETQAQFTRYLVKLKNKGGTPYTFAAPLAYLSQRAIDRRTKYGIAIDSTDLPPTPSYITQIRNVPNVTILNVSKWLNAVSIQTTDANAITTINAFPFVQITSAIAARLSSSDSPVIDKYNEENPATPLGPVASRTGRTEGDFFDYGASSYNEIHLHKGEFLHNIGLRGQGIQIAILDNGFNNYTSSALHAFDSVNANGQVLGTWDFVAREQNVTNDGNHGMQCFSTIAANIPGQFVGKAPKAGFWLYQTEDNASEYPIEEYNWTCGAERADSSGTDVLTTSLGYGHTFDGGVPDYPRSAFDGNTTISAIAADLAAKKGILVFVSAGNDGAGAWHFLSTPADADSVVTVGAVNTSGAVGAFSSYGPSADGQIKPDVASVGVAAVVQSPAGVIGTNNGTSFAAPNMAGLGACLRQGFPEFNNMRIVRALKEAGSIFNTPDDRIGYGIPNMKTAFASLLVDFATSNATVSACTATVNWTSKDVSAMKYEIERKAPGEIAYTKVGEINPQVGTILATHTYQFNNTIISPAAGTVSYRIRQVIDTAAASFAAAYIDTASITISSGCFAAGTGNPDPNKVSITVQPNPVSGSNVSLVIETPYAVSNMPVAVYDAKGRLMMQLEYAKGTGKKIIDLPIDKLAKGKYYIKVFNGQKAIGTTELLRL